MSENISTKKYFSIALISVFLLALAHPFQVAAQNSSLTNEEIDVAQEFLDTQRQNNNSEAELNRRLQAESDARSAEIAEQEAAINGLPTQNKREGDLENDAAADAVACAGGTLVAGVLRQGFQSISGLFNPDQVPTKESELRAKETGVISFLPSWDAIGYCAANILIKYISNSAINWINSGFDGNPTFVDDPEQFFKDLAEDELDLFIDSIGDGILCSQFRTDITLALVANFKQREQPVPPKCTYDAARNNIESMLRGESFSFDAFAVLTNNPSNNFMGAYLLADSSLNNKINQRLDAVYAELDWGDGFLSWKDKDDPSKTVTPGRVVADFSRNTLGLQSNRLILADEFDEVLDAAIQQLLKQAVTEVLGS